MAEGIIAVVCAVIVFILKRWLAKDKDLAKRLLDKQNETAKAIVEGDEDTVNSNLANSIKRLQNKRSNNSER